MAERVQPGQTFAEEAGIALDGGGGSTPKPLFELLVLSILLSSRVQHGLALRAFAALRKAGLTSAKKLAEATHDEVYAPLDGDYLRKDRTIDLLQTAAHQVLDEYGGDLRRLREAAGGDASRAAELLEGFKGIGPVGAEIFLREVQVAWDDLAPFYGRRVKDAAKARGLPSSDAKLAELGPPAGIAAALIRTQLSGDG